MLDDYGFSDTDKELLIDYIDQNKKKLRELSLRMVLKLADLRKSMPANWQAVAEVTCMRRA
jgi:hypothetical protein